MGLAGYILCYDTWAIATGHETMSTVFLRASKHKIIRWPVIAVVLVTIAHLFGRLPKTFDPFHGYSLMISRLDRRTPTL